MVFQNYALYPAHDGRREHGLLSLMLKNAPKAESDASRPARCRNPRPGAAARRATRASFPAASASASPWAAPLCATRRSSSRRAAVESRRQASRRHACEIKELHQRLKTTTVYVTHDQIEAMTMADKIVVMHDGIVEQIGKPLDLYDRPDNLFVASFIGSPAMNFLRGEIGGDEARSFQGKGGISVPLNGSAGAAKGTPVVLGIRPEHLRLSDHGFPVEVIVRADRLGNPDHRPHAGRRGYRRQFPRSPRIRTRSDRAPHRRAQTDPSIQRRNRTASKKLNRTDCAKQTRTRK